MSAAREEILDRIRHALGPERPEMPAPPHLRTHPVEVGAMLDEFAEKTADYRAVVERCPAAQVPALVAQALATYAAKRVVRPARLDPTWMSEFAGEVIEDESLNSYDLDEIDAVVTAAAVGIAATGTVVLDHGPDQGRRALSLVPDVHVCVIGADQVVPDVPQAVTALRAAIGDRRPLTWISGPSATSDIELDRVEGVHGPRTLHIIISE